MGTLNVADSITTGSLTATGTISFTGTGTSTFAGGVSAAGLNSSIGLTVSGATYLATGSGNVGIGTTAPAGLFHVGTNTTALGQSIFEQASADADSYDLNFRKTRGTITSPTVITTADELGVINFRGYSGAGGYVTGAAIKAISEGTIATTRVPAHLSFWTGTDAAPTVLTERMRIDKAGNVGIGTTAPGGNLHLSRTDGVSPLLTLERTGAAAGKWEWFIASGGPHLQLVGNSITFMDFVYNTGFVGIGTTSPSAKFSITSAGTGTGRAFAVANSSNAEKFTILDNGTVGIGTAAPANKLHVVSADDVSSTNIAAFWANNGTQGVGIIYQGIQKLASGANSSMTIDAKGSGILALQTISTGNVGIGTTVPQDKLHILNNGDAYLRIGGAEASDYGIKFSGQDFGNPTSFISKQGIIIDGSGGFRRGDMNFILNDVADGNSAQIGTDTKMIIKSGGNVGIGNTSPSYKLDVTGFINTDQYSGYKQAGNTILYASSTNFSTLVGISAGAALLSDGLYNTAMGYQALQIATSTDYNTAIGYQVLKSNIDGGLYNTGVGYASLFSNTTGTQNIANGAQSLYSNTTGNYNAASGFRSLYANTTGSFNTAYGTESLRNNTTGSYNTASGYFSLNINTTGERNTANGYQSLRLNTTGSTNTASGMYSLFSNTTGSNNTAIGYSSLYYNQSATSSTAFGQSAAQGSANYYNQGGTYIGYQAGFKADNASDYNTFIGFDSGYGVTTGANNILLGASLSVASYNQVTTGSNNISIGYNVAVASATASNQLNIGNFIYGTGLSGTGSTVSSGFLGIGTTTPSAKLAITGSGTGTGRAFAVANSSNAEKFTILDNGSVGIGNTAPVARLQITGSGNSNSVQPLGSIDNRTSLYVTNDNPLYGLVGQSIGTGPFSLQVQRTDGSATAYNLLLNPLGGNVGIGTTTPAAKLAITGSGTGTGRAFAVANSSNAEKFTILDNGSVGIGTTEPTVKLTVFQSLQSSLSNLQGAGVVFNNAIGINYTRGVSGGYVPGLIWYSGDNNSTIPKAGVWMRDTDTGSTLYLGASGNYGSGVTNNVVINGAGNVGIGTTAPTFKLHVAGGTVGLMGLSNNEGGGVYACVLSTGEVATSSSACGSSSMRFKQDIQNISYGLSEVMNLRPVAFNYNQTYGFSGLGHQIGFIAEEVAGVIPEVIGYYNGQIQSVDYPKLTAVLTKAVQELNIKVNTLTNFSSTTTTSTPSSSSQSNNTSSSSTSIYEYLLSNFVSFMNTMYDIMIERGLMRVAEIITHKITTDELCVGGTCVTEEEFQEVFGNKNKSSSSHDDPWIDESDVVDQEISLDDEKNKTQVPNDPNISGNEGNDPAFVGGDESNVSSGSESNENEPSLATSSNENSLEPSLNNNESLSPTIQSEGTSEPSLSEPESIPEPEI